MLTRKIVLAIAAGLTIAALPVHAHEQGDWIIRVGATNVDPDTDSDRIDVAGLATGPCDDRAGERLVDRLTDVWAIELLAATPFEHDISIKGAPVEAGSTKQLPPTLTVNWYPLGRSNSAFQPFIGAGVNYTYFWDEEVDKELGLYIVIAPGLAICHSRH